MTADPEICLVVAVAQNGVIGRSGELPWRLSSDLKWFKALTTGYPVIMGRKTFESIGRPLPRRTNIVVTRRPDLAVPKNVMVCPSLTEAMVAGCDAARREGRERVFVIGGADIYRQALPAAGSLYVTRVLADVAGDAQFDLPSPEGWDVEVIREIAPGPDDDFPARIEHWRRAGGPDAGVR